MFNEVESINLHYSETQILSIRSFVHRNDSLNLFGNYVYVDVVHVITDTNQMKPTMIVAD